MKIFRSNPIVLWLVGSVFMGPFIAISQFGFTQGGGDYCDSSYRLPNGEGFDLIRDTEFARSNSYADSLSMIMIIIGVVLLGLLLAGKIDSKSISEKRLFVVLTALMIAGYLSIIFIFSGVGGQSC